MKEEFKHLVRWVQECPVEVAMKIDELKGQIEQQQQEINRLLKISTNNRERRIDAEDKQMMLEKELQQAQEKIERLDDIIACFTFKDLIEHGINCNLFQEGIAFQNNDEMERAKRRAKEMGYFDWLFKEGENE